MTDLPKILLVDDEELILDVMIKMFEDDYRIDTAQSVPEALDKFENFQPDVVLTDLKMPGDDGLSLLKQLAEQAPDVPVIMVTGNGDMQTAILAFRGKAFDFIEKPFEYHHLRGRVKDAVAYRTFRLEREKIASSVQEMEQQIQEKSRDLDQLYESTKATTAPELPEQFSEIITQNPAMISMLKYLQAISQTAFPVLISGETGVGKDLVARAIHAASGRGGQYVVANVGGLDDALFSDTLFGHEPGAYTSATKKRAGLIESAAEGTLFLDEIGELSMASQVKLLRLVEGGEYFPLGSDKPSVSRARIVVATNRDLDEEVEKGAFRQDLLYRFQVHHVRIPSLRERLDDLPFLLDFFLTSASEKLEKNKPTIPKELLTLLQTFAFPGNVRQLQSMVFDALSRHRGGILSLDVFRERMRVNQNSATPRVSLVDQLMGGDGPMPTLKEAEELLINAALERAEGNQSIAAGMLGLTRQALNKRLTRKLKKVS